MSILERVQQHVNERRQTSASNRLRAARERLKSDLIKRLGLSEVASMVKGESIKTARQELRVACQAILNTVDYDEIVPCERDQLLRETLDDVVGLGPLQPLLDDDTITEVMVNGCESLFFEREGILHQGDRAFDTPERILMTIDRILAPLGRRLDESNPIVNARLANGYRVNAVAPPIAIDGPVVTIRKFTGQIISLDRLVALQSLPLWYAQLLRWAVASRQDIAVVGCTGSGKTTLLNALSCEIPRDERIVTIEDSAELKFETHPHVVRLEARNASIEGKGDISIRDLVTNALRMRPDRIVVGEVRGAECIDMLQAMNTGHDGSLTTLHAGTPEEAILRLVLMARFGMDLPASILEEQVATAIDLIVMGARTPDGSRVITSTSMVTRKDGGAELTEIVSFAPSSRSWRLCRIPEFVHRCVELGIATEEEVNQWKVSCSA